MTNGVLLAMQIMLSLVALAVLQLPTIAYGQEEIFDNGAPLSSSTGFISDDNFPQIFAIPVQLSSAKVATSIQWAGRYDAGAPATDDFSIEIYADQDGLPFSGAPLARFSVGNNVNRTPFANHFLYSAEIEFGFNANQTYWISIHDQNSAAGNFSWTGTGGTGVNNSVSFNGGQTWIQGGSFLFTLRLLGGNPPVVFDNGGSLNSTQSFFSDDGSGQIFAVPVQVAADTTVSSVTWTGNYAGTPPATDDFSIQVYPDNDGLPANAMPLATFSVGNDVNRILVPPPNLFLYTAEIDFLMKAGETYWITIHDQNSGVAAFGWAGSGGSGINNSVSFNGGTTWGQGGSFLFSLQLRGTSTFNPATNDDFESTTGILDDVFPLTRQGFNLGATTQSGEQQLERTGATVWWFINFPADGTATIDTFGSDYDTQLHIYEGFMPGIGVEDLIPVVDNDDAGGTAQSQVEFPVEAGECFEIRVGGWGIPFFSFDQGCIVLNIDFEESKQVLLGDVNCDGVVNLLDVGPFIDLIGSGGFSVKADINEDGVVNLLDVGPFIDLLGGG